MGGQVAALVTGPIAHPVNILLIAPGNYTFGDFFQIGWGLALVCFVMLLVEMALFWQLRRRHNLPTPFSRCLYSLSLSFSHQHKPFE